MAVFYRNQGKYEDAERLCMRSVAIREKSLGPDHPDVALSLHNLAILYYNQYKYDEAEPLYKRSLATYEKAFGTDHPGVAMVLESYAVLLRATQREAEAVEMETRAQGIQTQHAHQNVTEE